MTTKSYSELTAVEQLAFNRGEPKPKVELDRFLAELVVTALIHSGRHQLASEVKEAMQWAV